MAVSLKIPLNGSQHHQGHSTTPPIVRSLVSILARRRCARLAVCLGWALLAVGGLMVFHTFLKELQSSVPPVAGTPSFAAANAMALYFPRPSISVAMLIQSSAALLDFTNESTCTLAPKVDMTTQRVGLICKPHRADSLGGGCITKRDMIAQLAQGIENATAYLPVSLYVGKNRG